MVDSHEHGPATVAIVAYVLDSNHTAPFVTSPATRVFLHHRVRPIEARSPEPVLNAEAIAASRGIWPETGRSMLFIFMLSFRRIWYHASISTVFFCATAIAKSLYAF